MLVLGHGAGGGVEAPDLVAVTRTALDRGLAVRRIEQPYRVAGRRAPAPAAQLDEAWLAVLTAIAVPGLPIIAGGRSSGARVACRTAGGAGAVGVICLAFPVHPPGRPDRSRLPELDAVTVPVLCVAGSRDPFGVPPQRDNRGVLLLDGADHALRKGLDAVRGTVAAWLDQLAPAAFRAR
jgi:predicted alpha/beta-hydrolase family hydrolase